MLATISARKAKTNSSGAGAYLLIYLFTLFLLCFLKQSWKVLFWGFLLLFCFILFFTSDILTDLSTALRDLESDKPNALGGYFSRELLFCSIKEWSR